MVLYICIFPFEDRSFSFRIDISHKTVELFKVYKSNFPEENRLAVHIKFSPHFGKEYNPLALRFVPKDVDNLRVYVDSSYFDIPLKVEVTKYDLV